MISGMERAPRHERIGIAIACLSCALVVLGAVPPAVARAQGVLVRPDAAMPPVCVRLTTRCDLTPCADPGATCRTFTDGEEYCVQEDALFCAPSEGEPHCPADHPFVTRLFDADVCVSGEFTPCPTATGPVVQCFTDADDPVTLVSWETGDCDRDGQPNAMDPAPCAAAPTVGGITPDGACEPLRTLCTSDDECDASARCEQVSEADPHAYCVRSDGPAFCCGGMESLHCPGTTECAPDGLDGFGHCHPFCPELGFAPRTACLKYDGAFQADPANGDCDGDGLRNGDELAGDSDPCAAEDGGVAMPPDGGAELDAGMDPARDAGSGAMDGAIAGPGVTFGGGGGCRCGVGARGRAAVPWSIVLGGLVLARIAARRRR